MSKRSPQKPPVDPFACIFDSKEQKLIMKLRPCSMASLRHIIEGPCTIACADPSRRTGYAIGPEGGPIVLSGHTITTHDYRRLYYEMRQAFRSYPGPIDILVIEGQHGCFKSTQRVKEQGDGGGGGAYASQVTAKCAQVCMDVGIACDIPFIIDEVLACTWQSIHHFSKGVSRNRENLAAATQQLAFAIGLAREHGELAEDEDGMRMNQDEATAYCMHLWASGRLKQARMMAMATMAGKATGRTAA